MPSFVKPTQTPSTPFGKNQYLRSTRGTQFESGTVAKSTVVAENWTDGTGKTTAIKVLQSGEVMAKITSGADQGKYGPFQLGVSDGRQDVANLAGVNDTFIPWQLNERDVDAAFLYHGTCVQAWCFIRDATGKRIPLTDTVADALRGKKGLDVTFK